MKALTLLEAATLLGIEKLGVVVENIPPQLKEAGFQEGQLKAQVEEKLLQAGIEVLPEEDVVANGLPYLHLNINIMDTNVGLYVFATRVSLKQTVLLSQEPDLELYSSTWEVGGIGTVGVNNVEAVVESIRQEIDKFCHDYLAGNLEIDLDDYLGTEKPEPPVVSRQQLSWRLEN